MGAVPKYEPTDFIPPPWWAKRSKLVMEVWDNPLFQRNYKAYKIKWMLSLRGSFLIGFGISLLLNLITYFEPVRSLLMALSFEPEIMASLRTRFTIFIPALFPIVYLNVVVFRSAPIQVIRHIKNDMGKNNEINPFLTTPMTTRQIFLSECLPYGLKGLDHFLPFMLFCGGLLIPTIVKLINMCISGGWGMAIFILYAFLTVIILLLIFIASCYSNAISVITIGIYAINASIFGAQSLANFRASITALLIVIVSGAASGLLGSLAGAWMRELYPTFILQDYFPVSVGVIIFFLCIRYFTNLNLSATIVAGTRAFERKRRSGNLSLYNRRNQSGQSAGN